MANSVPSRPFPSDLNIQGSKFHIGSRGRWKGLYSVRFILYFIFTNFHDRPRVFSKTVTSFDSCLLPHTQGLLRQLVLVPGLDVTHQLCPSSDPRLAVLSVPPLLSDLHVTGRGGHDHVSSYGNLQTDSTILFTC